MSKFEQEVQVIVKAWKKKEKALSRKKSKLPSEEVKEKIKSTDWDKGDKAALCAEIAGFWRGKFPEKFRPDYLFDARAEIASFWREMYPLEYRLDDSLGARTRTHPRLHLIAFCFAQKLLAQEMANEWSPFQMDANVVNKILESYGFDRLYPRNKADACLIVAFNHPEWDLDCFHKAQPKYEIRIKTPEKEITAEISNPTTMHSVLKKYSKKLGLSKPEDKKDKAEPEDKKDKAEPEDKRKRYVFSCDGKETTEMDATAWDIGLQKDKTLMIDRNWVSITVKTGAEPKEVTVLNDVIVLNDTPIYKALLDVGVDVRGKRGTVFRVEDRETSDSKKLVKELGLKDGDVLYVIEPEANGQDSGEKLLPAKSSTKKYCVSPSELKQYAGADEGADGTMYTCIIQNALNSFQPKESESVSEFAERFPKFCSDNNETMSEFRARTRKEFCRLCFEFAEFCRIASRYDPELQIFLTEEDYLKVGVLIEQVCATYGVTSPDADSEESALCGSIARRVNGYIKGKADMQRGQFLLITGYMCYMMGACLEGLKDRIAEKNEEIDGFREHIEREKRRNEVTQKSLAELEREEAWASIEKAKKAIERRKKEAKKAIEGRKKDMQAHEKLIDEAQKQIIEWKSIIDELEYMPTGDGKKNRIMNDEAMDTVLGLCGWRGLDKDTFPDSLVAACMKKTRYGKPIVDEKHLGALYNALKPTDMMMTRNGPLEQFLWL